MLQTPGMLGWESSTALEDRLEMESGGVGLRRSTARSVGWALVFGVLVAVGPFRPSGWYSGLVAGILVAGSVLAFRYWRSSRAEAIDPNVGLSEALQGLWHEVRKIPISAGLVVAAFVVLYEPSFEWLTAQWRAGVWQNGHGLYVPVAMVYLGYRALRGEVGQPPEASAWGFAFLLPGLLLAVADASLHTRYLAAFGLVLTLPGLSLLFLGLRRTRKLVLPLALAIFMLPVPYTLSDQIFLRDWTVMGSEFALRTAGFSVLRNYTILVFPHFSLDVTYACSGFAGFYAGAFMSLILAAFARPWWRKAALILAIYPTALAANILRVVILTVLVQEYGLGVLETDLHPISGVAVFAFILGVMSLVAGRRTLKEMFG